MWLLIHAGVKVIHFSKRDCMWYSGVFERRTFSDLTTILGQRQMAATSRHFQTFFFDISFWISIEISTIFVPEYPINNKSSLAQIRGSLCSHPLKSVSHRKSPSWQRYNDVNKGIVPYVWFHKWETEGIYCAHKTFDDDIDNNMFSD